MKVAVLTNSAVSEPLINWLKETCDAVSVIDEEVSLQYLTELEPALVITYEYRYLISEDIVQSMGDSMINLHSSFLPWNRGTDADIWAVIDNTPKGITIHKIDKGINTGDILIQEELVFDESADSITDAREKLREAMLDMFKVNWKYLKEKRIIPTKQKKGGSTHRASDLDRYRKIIEQSGNLPIRELRKLFTEVK